MPHEAWQEQLRRGALELAVLLAVGRGRRYGLEILKHLDDTDLVVSEGVIYPILARLAKDGLLRSEWVADEGPRPRKYYWLTPAGRRRLEQMAREFREFTGKIERLIQTEAGS
jgi:PadR family transcriptional regulator, regulatory protein PadR